VPEVKAFIDSFHKQALSTSPRGGANIDSPKPQAIMIIAELRTSFYINIHRQGAANPQRLKPMQSR